MKEVENWVTVVGSQEEDTADMKVDSKEKVAKVGELSEEVAKVEEVSEKVAVVAFEVHSQVHLVDLKAKAGKTDEAKRVVDNLEV